jgi:DeoR/GlpR family transcriptional regulator of sugar metabolism
MHVYTYYSVFMANSNYFPEERHQAILERLVAGRRVVAAELARDFGTSEDTIRRDLREMAKEGLCQRIYGGALPVSPASGSFAERRGRKSANRAALGREAAKLVKAGQFLFLDAGTTNLEIAHALPSDAGLRVATNSPALAIALVSRPGISVLLIGGVVEAETEAALGAHAVHDLQALTIDLCFLGTCAISTRGGLRGFNFEDVEFKRTLVERSDSIAVAVTTDKLETSAPFEISVLDRVDHLIIEGDADPDQIKAFSAVGISVHQIPVS